jgi:hypothetical protein
MLSVRFVNPHHQLLNASTNRSETWCVAPEPISNAYFINASHQSVCLYVYVTRQRLGKNVTRGNEYTRINRVIGCVVLYAVHVYKSSWYSFLLEAESTPGP